MISISFNKENPDKVSIYMEKEPLSRKRELMEWIDSSFHEMEREYYINIQGLGATIEDYLSKVTSTRYVFTDEYRYKLWVKELPQLHLLTSYKSDLETLTEYMDSFHEGSISIAILLPKETLNLPEKTDTELLLYYAGQTSVLKMEIHSDGEVIDVENCNKGSYLIEICRKICEELLRENRGEVDSFSAK